MNPNGVILGGKRKKGTEDKERGYETPTTEGILKAGWSGKGKLGHGKERNYLNVQK